MSWNIQFLGCIRIREWYGGDRGGTNTPEADFCELNGINLTYNVGGKKTESSSNLIEGVQKT